MKKIISFSFLPAMLFVLAAAGLAQKPAASPSPTPTTTPEKLERTAKFDGNVIFPEVDGWDLSGRTDYPTPDMGYSVNYVSESGRVTVYVYNAGLTSIPDSLSGPVANEIDGAKEAIELYAEQGLYESAKEVKNETVTLGGAGGKVRSLHVLYALGVRGQLVDSHIYLFPYKNYFIKIRMTGPQVKEQSAETVALFKALDLMFAK